MHDLEALVPRQLRQVQPGLWSAVPDGQAGAPYDAKAALYDRLVGAAWYNRLMWGQPRTVYTDTAEDALASADGPLLDVGCGSLAFTAGLYRRGTRPVVAVDRSLGMLEIARGRLGGEGRVRLVQADVFDLPVAGASFPTVTSWGFVHLFEELGPLLEALWRPVAPGGSLHLTSLVLGPRWLSRWYLSALHRRGEVARPRTLVDVVSAVRATLGVVPDARQVGSLACVVARRPGAA